jgi:hypothetical protein
VSDQDAKYSDLVEIAKCSGDIRRNYGVVRGALLTAWMAHLATRPRPNLRLRWLIAASGIVYVAWKHWLGW